MIAVCTIKSVSDPSALWHGERIDVTLDTLEHGVVRCTLCPKDTTPYALDGKVVTNGELCALVARGDFGALK